MNDKTRNLLLWTGCIVIGLVFILAAVLKFQYAAQLERDMMGALGLAADEAGDAALWFFAINARILIALELALGLALMQPFRRRRVVLPVCLGLLGFFTLYLTKLAFLDKGVDNCGCFGAILPMGPLPSLLKTVAMLAVCAVLWKFSRPDPVPPRSWVPAAFLAVAAVLTFAITPPRPVRQSSEFSRFRQFSHGPVDLTRGAKIVAFFSLDCAHCKDTAADLAGVNEQQFPVYMIFLGEPEMVPQFLAEAQVDFPWLLVEDPRVFLTFIGNKPPRVILLQDGKRLRHWDQEDFDAAAVHRAWQDAR